MSKHNIITITTSQAAIDAYNRVLMKEVQKLLNNGTDEENSLKTQHVSKIFYKPEEEWPDFPHEPEV